MNDECSRCGRRSEDLDATWRLCASCHGEFLIDVELEYAWDELPEPWKRIDDRHLPPDEVRRVKIQRIRAFDKMQHFRTELRLADR